MATRLAARRPHRVLLGSLSIAVTVMLVALAAVNVTFIAWATVQDSRHAAAVTRALGATGEQITVSLCAAQILPAIVGTVVGIAGGYVLFTSANQGGSVSQPPAWWLITALLGTLIAVAGLTAGPARLATRLSIAEALQR